MLTMMYKHCFVISHQQVYKPHAPGFETWEPYKQLVSFYLLIPQLFVCLQRQSEAELLQQVQVLQQRSTAFDKQAQQSRSSGTISFPCPLERYQQYLFEGANLLCTPALAEVAVRHQKHTSQLQ